MKLISVYDREKVIRDWRAGNPNTDIDYKLFDEMLCQAQLTADEKEYKSLLSYSVDQGNETYKELVKLKEEHKKVVEETKEFIDDYDNLLGDEFIAKYKVKPLDYLRKSFSYLFKQKCLGDKDVKV